MFTHTTRRFLVFVLLIAMLALVFAPAVFAQEADPIPAQPANTAELLAAIAGASLSVVFSYAPKLKQKFEAQDGDTKRLVMLGLLVVGAVAVFSGTCIGADKYLPVFAGGTCDTTGAVDVTKGFLFAATGNQLAFLFSPKRA